MSERVVPRPMVAALALLPLILTMGCAVLLPFRMGPGGVPRDYALAQSLLREGRADSLLVLVEQGGIQPGDPLLDRLWAGLAAHYAGQDDRATELFEDAHWLIEEHRTRSASRAALSVLTNDRALRYFPDRTERLLLPYYAALGYLRQNRLDAAAVEARRLSRVLEEETDLAADSDGDDDDLLAGTLAYFSALVFQAAGDVNDARVAFRRAARLAPGLVQPTDTLPRRPDGTGEVIVLVEAGRAPVRVEEALYAWIDGGELRALTVDGDDDARAGRATGIATRLATRPGPRRDAARRIAANRQESSERACADQPPDTVPGGAACARSQSDRDKKRDRDDDITYLLKVAIPVLRSFEPAPAIDVRAGDATATIASASVASGIRRDFEAQQAGILARAVLRAAARLALTRAVENEVGDEDETAGSIAGFLASAGGVLLERADTRAWSLLPGTVAIARLRLPPGQHDIRIEAGGQSLTRPAIVAAGRTTFLAGVRLHRAP